MVDERRAEARAWLAKAQVGVADLAGWTDYAVAGRYPGFGDVRSEQDLPPLVACAASIVELVRKTLAPDLSL